MNSAERLKLEQDDKHFCTGIPGCPLSVLALLLLCWNLTDAVGDELLPLRGRLDAGAVLADDADLVGGAGVQVVDVLVVVQDHVPRRLPLERAYTTRDGFKCCCAEAS